MLREWQGIFPAGQKFFNDRHARAERQHAHGCRLEKPLADIADDIAIGAPSCRQGDRMLIEKFMQGLVDRVSTRVQRWRFGSITVALIPDHLGVLTHRS